MDCVKQIVKSINVDKSERGEREFTDFKKATPLMDFTTAFR